MTSRWLPEVLSKYKYLAFANLFICLICICAASVACNDENTFVAGSKSKVLNHRTANPTSSSSQDMTNSAAPKKNASDYDAEVAQPDVVVPEASPQDPEQGPPEDQPQTAIPNIDEPNPPINQLDPKPENPSDPLADEPITPKADEDEDTTPPPAPPAPPAPKLNDSTVEVEVEDRPIDCSVPDLAAVGIECEIFVDDTSFVKIENTTHNPCPDGYIVTGIDFFYKRLDDQRTYGFACTRRKVAAAQSIRKVSMSSPGNAYRCAANEVMVGVYNNIDGDDHINGLKCSPRASTNPSPKTTTREFLRTNQAWGTRRVVDCPLGQFAIGFYLTRASNGDRFVSKMYCSN